MRRRRLARLTALGENGPSSVSPPQTPISQSPINNSVRAQSPLQFEAAPKTPVDEKSEDLLKKHIAIEKNLDGQERFEKSETKYENTFQVPSKPIDINVPSSSKRASRPPQRSDSETSSTHMEVDEVSAEKLGGNTDIDSGIENMEVCTLFLFNFTSDSCHSHSMCAMKLQTEKPYFLQSNNLIKS